MYDYNASVIRIIGPLSFHLDIDLGFNVHAHETVRLDGLAQPTREHRGTVTGFVRQWITNHENLIVHSLYSREKYGRWLVEISCDDDDSILNTELITAGLVEHIDSAHITDDENNNA